VKKIAIFTEGQTESIFLRHLLLNTIDASKMKIVCVDLLGHSICPPVVYCTCPDPEMFFLVVDVHGDSNVVSEIKEREMELIERSGYDKILALRDLYCKFYDDKSPGVINDNVSNQITENISNTIFKLKFHEYITIYFAVMEIEAWFLSMTDIFPKIKPILTKEFLTHNLGYDFELLDPEKHIYKPSSEIKKILSLCGLTYDKKKHEIESIVSHISLRDYNLLMTKNKTGNFRVFFSEIKSIAGNNCYDCP
jgi:hypothetical protein